MATKKTKRGRKTKYTPETVQKIVQALNVGATYKIACDYAGIGTTTFYDWINSKPEFSDAVKEAEGSGAVMILARIRKEADSGSWQAGAWILERRYPEMYGRKVIQHAGDPDAPLHIVIEYEDDDDEPDDE